MTRALHLALAAALALACASATAHKASDAYLALAQREGVVDVRLDVALRDIDLALRLDADGDGAITWGEVKAKHGDLVRYVDARLALTMAGERCTLAAPAHAIDRRSDGAYAVLETTAQCAVPAPVLVVDYRLLFDVDGTHRALVRHVAQGVERTAVLSDAQPVTRLAADGGRLAQAASFFAEGVRHIAGGADHLLFLVALLLPAVLRRERGCWQPVASFRGALGEVVRIVTAFTVAHSITLALAVLGVVDLPSRLVEAVIAASVAIAALDNLRPVIPARATFAFAFGLVHGFGFAGALRELGLPDAGLALALAAFNVGVEAGQLAVAALLLPLAFAARASPAYRRFALGGGSVAIAVAGVAWLVERLADVAILALPGVGG